MVKRYSSPGMVIGELNVFNSMLEKSQGHCPTGAFKPITVIGESNAFNSLLGKSQGHCPTAAFKPITVIGVSMVVVILESLMT